MSKVLIEVNNLTKTIGERILFDDISLAVAHGEKVGLVGLNGCGKSTLMNIIAGDGEYDSGAIRRIPRGVKIGHLPQWIEFREDRVIEILDNALDAAGVQEAWLRRLTINQVLEKVSLERISPDFPTKNLSGGERTRLYLAKLLTGDVDFFLLDEPTNFLDIGGLQWIEDFVKNMEQGVLLVSHDRYFLDRVADRIIEMDDGSMHEYSGNYSFYRKEKAERIEKQWEEHRRWKGDVRRLHFQVQRIKQFARNKEMESVNDFARSRAKILARKAKSMETRMNKLEKVEKPRKDYMASIRFDGSVSTRIVAQAENLTKQFGERLLYSDVNFTINAGENVGILGENGSGKTTLLRILQGRESSTTGTAKLLEDYRVGYFSQIFEEMDDNSIVVELVMDYTGFDMPEARQLLAYFVFTGEEVFKKIGNLSVGDKSRVALACIKGKEPEALILDEPTNHLDVNTTEILEGALADYGGTIIIVTHDRVLLDSLVQKLLVIENEKITAYPGNYSYYLEKKRRMKEDAISSGSGGGNGNRDSARQKKLLLECRIAKLSGKLNNNNLSDEEKKAVAEEFSRLKAELQRIE